jgi:SAM-dependent methyltransferase
MTKSQDAIFLDGEADRYFARNQERVTGGGRLFALLVGVYSDLGRKPTAVLEIGCGGGATLARLQERFGARCVGIDPSARAVEAARARWPAVEFRRGVAAALPLAPTESFDLVIVNFVLHWIDRTTLLTSIAEIDRAIADHGLLALGDFLPDYPMAVAYHHLPTEQVFTYKQDYAAIFEATALFRTLQRDVFNHDSQSRLGIDGRNRGVVSVLEKRLGASPRLEYRPA